MVLAAIFQGGLTIGTTAGDSLFLSNIGVESLPYIYVVMPLIMVLYASLFSYLISKMGIKKLLYTSVVFVSAIALTLFILISFRDAFSDFQVNALYFLIKIFTTVIYIAFYSLYWNYADLYFDMSEGKRLFAYLAAGTALGVIAGGLTVTFATESLGVPTLFMLWTVSGLLSIPVIYYINTHFSVLTIGGLVDDEEEESAWQVLKNHWGSIARIRYVSVLAVMVFCVSLLAGIAEYQYYDVFSSLYTEAELAVLLGQLYAGVNVFNLIVCAFLFNRLVLRIGVTNVAMIQPVVYIFAFSYLLLDYGFGAAILAFFAYQGMAWSVDNNNYNLLYNALPNTNRAQLRTILEGLLEPMATAIAGVYLLFYASKVPAEGISLVGFLGALILFAFVILMKKNYLKSLVQNLKTEWLDFSKKFRSNHARLSDQEQNILYSKMDQTFDEAVSALSILIHEKDPEALSSLLRVHDRFAGMNMTDREVNMLKYFFELFLNDTNYHNTRTLIQWFNTDPDSIHPQLAELFAYHSLIQPDKIRAFAESEHSDVKNIALIASMHSANLQQVAYSVEIVQAKLLGNHDEVKRALRILQYSKNPVYATTVIPYIYHTDPEIRHTALKTIRDNVPESAISFVTPITDVIKHNEGEVRDVCIDILEKINDPICVKPLLMLSPELTPSERRHTENMIVKMGSLIIPIVVSVLSDVDANSISRSLAARILYRIAPEHFELIYPDLIDEEIEVIEKLEWNESVLELDKRDIPAIAVLKRFYRDIRTSKVNLILEILSTAGLLPAYELVINSLKSTNQKIRAFGIEMLEEGLNRDLFNKILSHLDTADDSDRSHVSTQVSPSDIDSVIAVATRSTHPIEKSAALTIIWQLDKSTWINMIKPVLSQKSADIVKETTVARLHNESDREQSDFLQRLILLCASETLAPLHIYHLEYLAHHSEIRFWPKHEIIHTAGQPANHLYVCYDGRFTYDSGTSVQSISQKGDVFPIDTLKSKQEIGTLVTEGGSALSIPFNAIIRCSTLYPEVAMYLFQMNRR